MRRNSFLVLFLGTALAISAGFTGVAGADTGPTPIATPTDARNDAPSRAGQWVRVTYGPFTIPAASPYGEIKNAIDTSVPAACSDCRITDIISDLVDNSGRSVNLGTTPPSGPPKDGVMQHHFVLINPTQPDLVCGSGQGSFGQRFFAAGNERTHLHLPQTYGYTTDAASWALIYHLVNFNAAPQTVNIELKMRYRPKAETLPATPAWLDIDGCGSGIGGNGDSDYSINPGYSDFHDPDGAPPPPQPPGTYTSEWQIPSAWTSGARLIAVAGHSHDVDVTGQGSCVPDHCEGEGGGIAVSAELLGGPVADYFGPALGPGEFTPSDITGATLCRSKANYGTSFAGGPNGSWNGHLDTMSLCGIFSDVPVGAQAEAYPPGAAYPFAGYPVSPGQRIRLHSEYQNNTGFTQTDVMGIMLPWFAVGAPAPQYPRPGGATPLRVPLVPEYNRCTAPNSNHISPLNSPSCSPPVESSQVLTTASTGKQSASARYDVQVGNAGTPADEANVRIAASATDVICKAANAACPGGAGSDYTGKVVLATTIRVTDRQNGAAEAGTVVEREFYAPFTCVATGAATGGTCSVVTTADALVPNYINEQKRTIMAVASATLKDAGPNGTGYTTGCPQTCGDGDEAVYLRQGVFTP